MNTKSIRTIALALPAFALLWAAGANASNVSVIDSGTYAEHVRFKNSSWVNTAEIRGGFGGPAGSSDVGTHPGFETPGPTDHWKVGAPLRIAGFACLATAAALGLALTLARAL